VWACVCQKEKKEELKFESNSNRTIKSKVSVTYILKRRMSMPNFKHTSQCDNGWRCN
jgi:hypothetical protein